MPTGRFSVTIRSRCSAADALADCGRYLAYADQTDLFGYHGKVEDTSVSLQDGTWYVTIEFEAPVAQESDISEFLSECDTLARVGNAECLTNPNL